jgi:hypothetical protein
MALAGRVAADREDMVDGGVEQAFAEGGLSDHAGRAEEEDLHRVPSLE